MSAADLGQILERLQKSGGPEDVAIYKQAVSHLINQSLTDLKKVSESLSRSDTATHKKHYEHCLRFISHCVAECPQILVGAPPDGDQPSGSSSANIASDTGYTLTFWVISRLLRILGHLGCGAIYEETEAVLKHLVNVIRPRDPALLSSVLKLLIHCMKDAAALNQLMYDEDEDAETSHEITMETSRLPTQGEEEQPLPLNVPDLETCELIQTNIGKFLLHEALDICQFLPPGDLVMLWEILCTQLEWGEIELKKSALVLCERLLQLGVEPPLSLMILYTQCLTALLQLLVCGNKEVEGDYEGLENALAASLSVLSSHKVVTKTTWMELAVLVIQHGFGHLVSCKLKQTVCCLLVAMMHTMSTLDVMMGVMNERRMRLIQKMIDDIGETDEQELFVDFLARNIVMECEEVNQEDSSNKTFSDPSVEINAESSYTKMDTSENKRTKHSSASKNLSQTPSMKHSQKTSKTLQCVKEKLDVLCDRLSAADQLQGEEQKITAGGLKTLLRVIAVTANLQNTPECSQIDLLEWMNLGQVTKVTETVRTVLETSAKNDYVIRALPHAYSHLVEALGIIATADASQYPGELLTMVTWILSFTWLPDEVQWLDLKPAQSREVGQLAAAVAAKKIHWDPACLGRCVTYLSQLPKEAAPRWRSHVLKVAMSDSSVVVRQHAVKVFPLFLYHAGPNANHLVYDLLHDQLHCKEDILHEELAEAVGPLVCVVSRKAVISRGSAGGDMALPAVKCSSCDLSEDQTDEENVKARPRLVDPAMFKPFLQLLREKSQAKTKFVKVSLGRLLGHLGVKANNAVTMEILKECLQLMNDPEYDVRLAFSSAVKNLVRGVDGETISQIDETIVSSISAVEAESQGNPRLQETLLLTVGQLGRVAEGELLLVVLVSLVKSVCCPASPLAAAVAVKEIQAVAKHKQLDMGTLFTQHRRELAKFLVETIYGAVTGGGACGPQEILERVASVFEYEDTKTFLQSTQKYLVPHLVSKATTESSQLIKMLAQEQGDKYKKMLVRNVKHIFSHAVCTCPTAELKRALTFLQAETEIDLGRLLLADSVGIMNELLLHLSTHYTQVFRGLNILASKCKDEKYPETEDISTREQLANYIQPRLLGILVFFDNQLLNNTIPLQEKKEALQSIVSIMELLGPKHITAVRVRVMTTLRNGLQLKGRCFAELSCKAWNCFVHSVQLSVLGPMLPQIIVSLMGLLKELPKQVAQIFHFLIVENRANLSQYFCDLYFMPETPELTDVNAVLREHNKGRSSEGGLGRKVEHLLRGITHESLDIKRHALSKLRQLLHNNQSAVQELILGGETVDPVISNLVSVLLAGCRESNSVARSLCGECLGEIGAIDPGRLELMTKNPKEELTKFQASAEDENFIHDLVTQLAKAFLRAKETTTQDCVAVALQEILRTFDIKDEGNSNSAGCRLWRRFPENVQEILTPLLRSRYKLHYPWDWSNLVTPVYGSRKGSHFTSWVCTVTGYLASKVKQDKPREVFEACRGVIKHDSQIALYLLPNVVVHALLDGTEVEHAEISKEILAVLTDVKKPASRNVSSSDFRHMSAQTVFSLLDHLTKWTRHRVMVLSLMSSHRGRLAPSSSDTKYTNDSQYQCIKGFLEKIPQDILALASSNCQAPMRALMHIEQYIKAEHKSLREHLDFIQKLYLAMDEPDGVAGVTAIKSDQPSLMEEVLAHESLGQLADASACYSKAVQLEPDDVSHQQGLLKCFMNLGQFSTSMALADGVAANKRGWSSSLNAYRVEAAWKLGQWGKLEHYLKTEDHSSNWNISLGKILLAAKIKEESSFKKEMSGARNSLMGPLSAASMEWGSYQRGYEYIIRLHMLNETEQGLRTLLNFPCNSTSQDMETASLPVLLQQWEQRLTVAQSSYRTLEPVNQLRRAVLSLAQQDGEVELQEEIGKCWLQSAKVARKAGHLQTAYSALLNAASFNLPEFCLEKAKYLWEKGHHDQARSCLEKAMDEQFHDKLNLKQDTTEQGRVRRLACAKVLLLLGRYQEETASLESNAIVKQYKEVIELNPEWEDGYFHCAKYYDKIMTKMIETERPEKRGEFVVLVVQRFGMSLMHGNQYIYQSMPRLLTLWLDYGASVVEEQRKSRSETTLQTMTAALHQLNKTMVTLGNKLAAYQFLVVFPQLISRICHTHPEVFKQLLEIIAQILSVFPQQAMWMMMAVSKSSYQMRVKRCQEIFTKAKLLNPDLNKYIQDATKLTDRLLDLCNKQVETGVNMLSITQHFKPLQRLIDDRNFSEILLPLQSLMTVSLPTSAGLPAKHDPFPGKQIYIQGLEDTVEVLASLQRPKKITLQGSDGRLYIMLCKPKDDLRKDARLMEFNGIINKCLRKDPESRRRELHIRTYTVTPLNEECGMLEWVPNTHGLRNILMKLYKERGLYTSGKELRSFQVPVNAPIQRKLDVFKTKLIPRHPAIFSEWFLKTFPDPTSWYNARLAYCRTAAVMSMVGYILGLGDRHGENILMDSVHGDCVHVDFNCLFNKGETFDYPEIVPFRLTHNMVEAMGPLGVEGVFRQACEVTLRGMRDQSDSLMSVLKTFIYDPLVEWSKPARGRSAAAETGEIKNEKAYTSMMNVETRLKGLLKNKAKMRGLALSVEGHVNHLILESTDVKNLSQMYIGWAAYL